MPSTPGKQVKPRAKKDSSEVRTRILEASRRLLARGGLEALTISQIAAEAGVYSSAVFYHFGGKEGLWTTLVVGLLKEANASTLIDVVAMPLGRERIERVVESYFMIGGRDVQSAMFETTVPALRSPSSASSGCSCTRTARTGWPTTSERRSFPSSGTFSGWSGR